MPGRSALAKPSYTASDADVGHVLKAVATATNAGGVRSVTLGPSAVVRTAAPVNTSLPIVIGNAQVGQSLAVASNGVWSGSPTSFGYQWQHCNVDVVLCTDVAGATGTTYALHLADLGFRMRVVVTAS